MTDRPPIEHVEWVFKMLLLNAAEAGSFRKLIYDHMGYGHDAYKPLYDAGGLYVVNLLSSALDRDCKPY